MSDFGFPLQPLSDLVTAIRDGTHGTHRRVAAGVPLLSAKNVTANGGVAFDETDDLISEAEYLDLNRSFRLEPDDLLLTIVGSLGRRAIYAGQRVTFQRSVAYIRPEQRKLLSRFLFHWMGHPAFSAELARRSNATAQAGLYLGELAKVAVPVPDKHEQRGIAQVLDTLDSAIHEAEAIVAKLKAVKQGLLHDLLTRGIDANGELRLPQAEAPHLYKESPLGWIPEEWEVVPLGELSESLVDGPFGSNLKTAHYVENPGVRVVRLQNILAGEYDDSERAFISERHAASLVRNRVTAGDALIASLGDSNYPVGRSCCYPANMPDAINKADCFRFRAGPRCRNEFVMHSMNGAAAGKQVRGYEQGVTMKRINLGNLRRITIAIPLIPEQELIAERMRAVQQEIEVVTVEHRKLRSEKSGLMDDLLTGRVRVTPLLAETEKGVA